MGPNPVVRENVQLWVMLAYGLEMFGCRDDMLGAKHELVASELAEAEIGFKLTPEW